MEDPQRWNRTRYVSLVAVSALHFTVVIVLIITAKTRMVTPQTMPAIELFMLRRPVTQPAPAPPPSSVSPKLRIEARPSLSTAVSDAITGTPTTDAAVSGERIDWAQEARDVAASLAAGDKSEPSSGKRAATSPFLQPPPHYKGEQIQTADGRWMVFVSEDCYQFSKEITYIENKTNMGKKIQTYCNRRSKTPRGDLFKELPAYKRLHPDD
jgi:hypothetical protein